jgi:hypothetical protein
MPQFTDITSKTVNDKSNSDRSTKVLTSPRKLVKLEIDFIPQIRTKWDKILTDRLTDREQAESAINACYRYVGLEQSRILWTENPLTAMKFLIDRPDLVDVGSGILKRIWDSCNQEIDRQIDPEFIEVVKAYANPRAQIIGEKQNIAFDPLGDFLNQVSISEIQKSYPQFDPLTLPAAMQDYRIAYLSYFDYFNQIGVDIPQVQLLVDLAKSCGCCWAFGSITILTPKAAAIEFSDLGELRSLVYDGINILG